MCIRDSESIVVVEAAGHDVVFVETVGVGQSEVTVASMVDTFVLLMLARTGDSLQGIKKGVLELADVIAFNKADGTHRIDAQSAARELAGALHLMASADPDAWPVPVLTCSAVEAHGLDEVWAQIEAHRAHLQRRGEWESRRRGQDVAWMWSMVEELMRTRFRANPAVRDQIALVERDVRAGELLPAAAALRLLATDRP